MIDSEAEANADTTPLVTELKSPRMPFPSMLGFVAPVLACLLTGPGPQEVDAPRELADRTLQPRIDRAIDSGIEHLLARQHRDGTWTGAAFGSYRTGPTAFAAYALVESGVRPDSVAIRLALDYLERTPPTMVYSAGAILLLLGEIGDEQYADLAQDCLDQLIDWESSSVRGTWSYPSGPVDLSNMQFVALGFWAAERLGLDVPDDVVQRLVEATIDHFQEEPFDVEPKEEDTKRSRSRPPRAAGFHYFLERDRRIPSGSMTAAGICIQRIAREVSGKRLGRKLLRRMDASEGLGLRWLDAHWSVTENFGHHEGGQLIYYLYALERLGAFYDTDTIEGHLWYEPGARTILGEQDEDGGWGRLHETDYALLFLGRASRSSSTGPSARRRDGVWSLDSGPVRIHANGRMEIAAWITELECERPFSVERVEWSVDGEVQASLRPDDPGKPWNGERFPFRMTGASIGKHTVEVRVSVRRENETRLELVSEKLEVECRPSAEEWMRRACVGAGENLLDGVEVESEATSEAAGQFAARAVDGYEGTAWIPGGEPNPVLRLRLGDRGALARSVTLSSAASSFVQRAAFAGLERIRVTVNGKAEEHTLDPSFPGTVELALPKRVRVRTLAIEVLAPTQGKRGIAEIGLR